MADLPDLDTTTISFIAFWSAIDSGGVSSIDPEDALSDGAIQNFTLYDNGWEGDYTLVNGRTATVRVKRDGWFIAYLDRTANFTQRTSNRANVRGQWDILNNWYSRTSAVGGLQNNALERAINSLQSQLGNAGSITYAAADVGLYDYEVPSATEYVLFSNYESYQNRTATVDLGFLHSSKNVHKGVVLAAAEATANYSYNSFSHVIWDPDGLAVTLANPPSGNNDEWGSYDHTAEIGTGETEYKTEMYGDSATSNNPEVEQSTHHLLWSSDA